MYEICFWREKISSTRKPTILLGNRKINYTQHYIPIGILGNKVHLTSTTSDASLYNTNVCRIIHGTLYRII